MNFEIKSEKIQVKYERRKKDYLTKGQKGETKITKKNVENTEDKNKNKNKKRTRESN